MDREARQSDRWSSVSSVVPSNRPAKADPRRSELYRQADATRELARLTLYANGVPSDDIPRSANPCILANFPTDLLRLVLDQTYEPRSVVESSFEPTANSFDRQNTRRVFQRVCFSWSQAVDRTQVAVTGASNLVKLRAAFDTQEGGRTASELVGLTVDFRAADSRATFEASGKALGDVLEVCVNLETLEIVLPSPGVDGEEVVGLASLAVALDKTSPKLKILILRCVPEIKRNRDGTRKFASPLVLRLSILSPFVISPT